MALTCLLEECFPAVQGVLYYSKVVVRPLPFTQALMWHFQPLKLFLKQTAQCNFKAHLI